MTKYLVGSVVILGLFLALLSGSYTLGYHNASIKAERDVAENKAQQTTAVAEKKDEQVQIRTVVETKEVEKVVYRDRYIDRVVKQVEYVAKELKTCPVSVDAVRLWNQTAQCALHPGPSECPSDDAVSGTGEASGTR